MDERVELSFCHHGRDIFSGRHPLQEKVLGQVDLHLLVILRVPLDLFVRHLELMLEDAADPKISRRGEVAQADFPANEVRGFADALAGVDEGEAMPEAAMEKYRNRGKGLALKLRCEVV